MAKIEYRIESAGSAAAANLIAALDDELSRQYPGLPVNGIDVADFEAGGGVFAVGYVDGKPAVSGAFRPFEGEAEIKRMFVLPAARGRGLGRGMLAFLEAEAARRGYARAVLETGNLQREASASIAPWAGPRFRFSARMSAARSAFVSRSCSFRPRMRTAKILIDDFGQSSCACEPYIHVNWHQSTFGKVPRQLLLDLLPAVRPIDVMADRIGSRC